MRSFSRILVYAGLLIALVAAEGVEAKRRKPQPKPATPEKVETPAPVETDLQSVPELKSPSTATKKSVWYTLGSLPTVVFAVPGIIVGPSTGYFYGGMPGRGWLGIVLRTVGVAAMIIPIGATWQSSGDDTWAGMMFGGGALLLVGSAIADMASVGGAVKRRNAKIMGPHLSVSPAVVGQSQAPGLRVQLRF